MITPTKIAFAAALILGSTSMVSAQDRVQAMRYHASAATHPVESSHARKASASCELSPDPCEESDDWSRAGGSSRP